MRVIAGSARGRRLVAPPGDAVRPTSDRVREATFNALGSLGAVQEADVLDLFAGSGALGIEALSRGAAHCTFTDQSSSALDSVRTNLSTTGLEDRADVRRTDAFHVLGPGARRYDLVLADPPYGFDRWEELLADLTAPLVVIESRRAVEVPPPWSVLRQRTYGTTVVTIIEYPDATGSSQAQDLPEGPESPRGPDSTDGPETPRREGHP